MCTPTSAPRTASRRTSQAARATYGTCNGSSKKWNIALVSPDQAALDPERLAGFQHLRMLLEVCRPVLGMREVMQPECAQARRSMADQGAVAPVREQDAPLQVGLHETNGSAADDGAELLSRRAQCGLGPLQRSFQPVALLPTEQQGGWPDGGPWIGRRSPSALGPSCISRSAHNHITQDRRIGFPRTALLRSPDAEATPQPRACGAPTAPAPGRGHQEPAAP